MGRVLITGSSRGIGRAIALKLAQDGWSIALHYGADEDEAAKTKKLLGKRCAGVYQADLSSAANSTELFKKVTQDGALDAVVNNAGVYMPLDFVGSGDAAFHANWKRTFAVNFDSPMMLTRQACRHFA